jgi:asparagine synthase (glutamine-hydrolysing)
MVEVDSESLKNVKDVLQLSSELDERSCTAFSGGVDSSLLARLVELQGLDLSLISIGFGEYDEADYIAKAADLIGGELYYQNIPLEELEKGLTHTLELIEYDRIALLENAVGYYFIFKLASHNGFNTVLSAHGVDELFCGYDVFRREYNNTDLNQLIDTLTETAKQDNQIIEQIAGLFKINYRCPFLENEFIAFSKTVPPNQKIRDENDKLRKHYIREQATQLGLPDEIAYRAKSSLQYSSGLHKAIRRLARKNGYTNKTGKQIGYESGMMAYIMRLKKDVC